MCYCMFLYNDHRSRLKKKERKIVNIFLLISFNICFCATVILSTRTLYIIQCFTFQSNSPHFCNSVDLNNSKICQATENWKFRNISLEQKVLSNFFRCVYLK